MKPAPPPKVPGNTESERFDNALRTIFSVSKEDALRADTKQKPTRRRKEKKTV